jgi:hypothetical protein
MLDEGVFPIAHAAALGVGLEALAATGALNHAIVQGFLEQFVY